MSQNENYFTELAKIDVGKYVEKKGKFSYLSWPYAIEQLSKADPDSSWEVIRFDGVPYLKTELGYFVEVAVTCHGNIRSQIHPVLDNNNRPIAQPTTFQINTSIQRCLVKAIALHGLGLYIYAGEDLPETDEPAQVEAPKPNAREEAKAKAAAKAAEKKEEKKVSPAPKQNNTPAPEKEDGVEPINENHIKAIGNMLNILGRKKEGINTEEFLDTVVKGFGKEKLDELSFEQGKDVVKAINEEMRKK